MTQAPQDHDLGTSLRAALLGAPPAVERTAASVRQPQAARPATFAGATARPSALPPAPPPTAAEMLEASPNIQRLCESYHNTHKRMVERSRRQRVGIALLVGALAVTTFLLARDGRLNPVALNDIAFAIAGACVPALGVMALLWVRDDHRLRDAQGERLLRALQFNCGISAERIHSFLQQAEPTAAFFECYTAWRAQHRDPRTGLARLVGAPAGRTRATAA